MRLPSPIRVPASVRATIIAALVGVSTLAPSTAAGTPAVGATADRSVRDAGRVADGSAVPLRAPTPEWVTPALLRRVHAARGRGIPVSGRTATAASIERGIRPGALMVDPAGCTMNFIFRRRGDLAIGTAAHCVERVGQRVALYVRNPSGRPVVVSVGRVVKRALARRGSAPDFALVRLRERLERWVNPAIASLGGPCGTFRGTGIRPLWHYGYPLAAVGAERVGYSLAWRRIAYSWAGAAVSGDSGSPVRTAAGRLAAGNLTHVGASLGRDPGTVFGTRMTWINRYVRPWRLVRDPSCR